jgi:hypothetical protein
MQFLQTELVKQNKVRKRMTKETEGNTSKIRGHKVWLLGVADYSGRACICLSLETAKIIIIIKINVERNWQN